MILAILDWVIIIFGFFYFSLFFTNYSPVFGFFYKLGFGSETQVSNIISQTGVFLFLLFLHWLIARKDYSKSLIVRIFRKFSGQEYIKYWIGLAVVFLFLVLASVSITKHFSLGTSAYDLGIFDQAIWNTTQADMFFCSLKDNMNLLGDHFEPILLFLVLLYKFWPNVVLLLLVQSLLLASAIIPIYLISKIKIKEHVLIFAIIFSYILSRPLRGIAYCDFHPEAFIVPLIFWIYYFLIKKNNLLLFISLFFLLLCKEDTAFLIISLGIFTCFFERRIKLGIFMILLGVISWLFMTKIIIPFFNPTGGYQYLNRLPFGDSYLDNVVNIISNPQRVINVLFIKDKLNYCFQLIWPLGFLPLLSPAHYILIFVPMLKNILPIQDVAMYDIGYHYVAHILPFLYISLIYGIFWLRNKIKSKKAPLFIAIFLIMCSAAFYGKTDGHRLTKLIATIKKDKTLEKIGYLQSIPKNSSVSITNSLLPHISHRKYIFLFKPLKVTSTITEYVVIDKDGFGYLTDTEKESIPKYLDELLLKGYKLNFISQDKKFLIFFNPAIDKTLVEKYRG